MLHPDHLVRQLNARQLAEWQAFFLLEPLGEERADMRMARMCWLLAAVNGNKGVTEEEFRFKFHPDKPKTAKELRRTMLGFKRTVGQNKG